MLDRLKNLDLDRIDLDEAIFLSSLAKQLRQEYEHLNVEAPEWLDIRVRELGREIRARQADAVEKRLRELRVRREALGTPDEKRAKIDAEIAKLEQMVAGQ